MKRNRSSRGTPPARKPRVISWWWPCALLGLCLLVAGAAVTMRPALVQYRLWRAQRALAERDTARALRWLESADRLPARRAATQFWLARAWRQSGYFQRSLEHLERAGRLGYSGERLRRERLLTLVQAGQLPPGDAQVTALLQDPQGDALQIYEAVTRGYLDYFEMATALVLLDGWQADYPDDPQPYFLRGSVHMAREDWTQAAAAFRQALQRDARRIDVRLQLAAALRQRNEYHEALEQYQYCRENADSPEATLGVGLCSIDLGELDKGREILRRLLDQSPDNFEGRAALGELELSFGHAAEALRWLEPAARQSPSDIKVRQALAWAYVLSGQADKAREQFQFTARALVAAFRIRGFMRRIKADPLDAEARCAIAAEFLQWDQPDKALRFVQSVLQTQPQHPDAHRLLVELHEKYGAALTRISHDTSTGLNRMGESTYGRKRHRRHLAPRDGKRT